MPRRDRPPQPTRVMVLALLMLIWAILSVINAAQWYAGEGSREPVLAGRVHGHLALVDGLVLFVLMFMLLANSMIGRWATVGYGVVSALFEIVLLLLFSMQNRGVSSEVLLPAVGIAAVFVFGRALLLIALAYPTDAERAARRSVDWSAEHAGNA